MVSQNINISHQIIQIIYTQAMVAFYLISKQKENKSGSISIFYTSCMLHTTHNELWIKMLPTNYYQQTTKLKIFTIFNGIKSLQVKEDCHMTTKTFDHWKNYKVQDRIIES